MLGTDLLRELKFRGHSVAGYNRLQCDITSPDQLTSTIGRERPRIVFNCAAYTNVDGAESDEASAFQINATGAGNVAQACAQSGARCIYLSTDYVFDGTKSEPYLELDTPAPLSAYGRSKLAGEEATTQLCAEHLIVRTAWLYGHHGRNFVTSMLNAARSGQQLRVVDDQQGSPTSTLALARFLSQLAAASAVGIVHATCAGDCTWFDFANAIFEYSGLHPASHVPVTTAEFPRPAKRPMNSRLACGRLLELQLAPLPHWRDALQEYLLSLQLERC